MCVAIRGGNNLVTGKLQSIVTPPSSFPVSECQGSGKAWVATVGGGGPLGLAKTLLWDRLLSEAEEPHYADTFPYHECCNVLKIFMVVMGLRNMNKKCLMWCREGSVLAFLAAWQFWRCLFWWTGMTLLSLSSELPDYSSLQAPMLSLFLFPMCLVYSDDSAEKQAPFPLNRVYSMECILFKRSWVCNLQCLYPGQRISPVGCKILCQITSDLFCVALRSCLLGDDYFFRL